MTGIAAAAPAGAGARRRPLVAVALGLAAVALIPYLQVGGFEFIACDDPEYVYENPTVLRGLTADGLRYAFAGAHVANWHPLTWLSHMLDCEVFADGVQQWAGGHHLVNAVIHAAATMALFAALVAMLGRPALTALVAALFAVHPQHVESVAWVAERKDVLSGLCWNATLLAYALYARRPTVARYAAVAAGLALGLMAKAMVVTLPFVLLLLDVWPLRRAGAAAGPGWRRLVVEKVPLLLMVAVASWVTFASQQAGGAMREVGLPLLARVANALIAWVAYLGRTLWPTDLAIFYPHPWLLAGEAWSTGFAVLAVGAGLLLAAISWLCVRQRRQRPHLLVGWLWYLGTLMPVIGLIQVGAQARADRYTYLPLVGVFLAVCVEGSRLLDRHRVSTAARCALGGVLVLALTAASAVQTSHWRDDLRLFAHAVAVVPDNYLAHNHLGLGCHRRGRLAEAAAEFDRAIAIRPDYDWALNNRAVCHLAARDFTAAEGLLRRALAVNPTFADAWNNLGSAQFQRRRFADAAASWQQAVRTSRTERLAYSLNLALACEKLARWEDALRIYLAVLQQAPDDQQAASRAGLALAAMGRVPEARTGLERLLQAHPDSAMALHALGVVAALERDAVRAEDLLRRAVAADAAHAEAMRELAALLAAAGRHAEAAQWLERALAIEPGDPDAHNDLAVAYGHLQQKDRVGEHLQAALRIQSDHAAATSNLRDFTAGTAPTRASRNRP